MKPPRAYRLFAAGLILSLLLACLPTAAASAQILRTWVGAQEHNGVVYFLSANPNEILRYNLAAGNWLAPLPLPAWPSAFWVDEAIYVAYNGAVERMGLNGGTAEPVITLREAISDILGDADFVFLISRSYAHNVVTSVRKTSRAQISQADYWYDCPCDVISPSARKLVGVDDGWGAVAAGYSATGVLDTRTTFATSNYGDGGFHLWGTPDQRTLITDHGGVYNTLDLRFRLFLPQRGDTLLDVDFAGDQLVALQGSYIRAYTNSYLLRGQIPLNAPAHKIAVHGDAVFAFTQSQDGVAVANFPLSRLNIQTGSTPVDPLGLDFPPDAAVVGTDQVLYMLSAKYQSIFRYDLATRRYLSSLALDDIPMLMTYAPALHRLYIGYSDGRVTKIDLSTGLTETAFAVVRSPFFGIAAAGEFLVVGHTSTNGFDSISTFNAQGATVTGSLPLGHVYTSRQMFWHAGLRRLYHTRTEQGTPDDLHYTPIAADGSVGPQGESPYHGEYPISYPVLVDPAGTTVLLGSGHLFDANTLAHTGVLPSGAITDAAWTGAGLFTLRANGINSRLDRLDGQYAATAMADIPGTPLRVLPYTGGVVVLTTRNGQMVVRLYDTSLNLLAEPPVAQFAASPLEGSIPLTVQFTNTSTGQASGVLWDFGDGATSTEANPTHVYTRVGRFSPRLIVTGPGGQAALIQEGAITTTPVAITFTADTQGGFTPLTVRFTAQVGAGVADSHLWVFGDGTTSTEANPTHVYTQPGNFTPTLTVQGPYGPASYALPAPIQARARLFLPAVSGPPLYTKPGSYTFNLCQTYNLRINGVQRGTMTECVESVDALANGNLRFHYSWRWTYPSSEYLLKYSDRGNFNMYIVDGAGNRYYALDVGGAADEHVYMWSGETYHGWFLFSYAKSPDTNFNFVDGEAPIVIGPMHIPGN